MDQPIDNRTKDEEDFRLQTSDFILQTSDFRLQKFFFLKLSEVGSLLFEVPPRLSHNQYLGFFFQYTYTTLPIRLAIVLYEYKRVIPV